MTALEWCYCRLEEGIWPSCNYFIFAADTSYILQNTHVVRFICFGVKMSDGRCNHIEMCSGCMSTLDRYDYNTRSYNA